MPKTGAKDVCDLYYFSKLFRQNCGVNNNIIGTPSKKKKCNKQNKKKLCTPSIVIFIGSHILWANANLT